LLGLDIIRSSSDLGTHHKFYFEIPLNEKLFRDIIIRNVLIDGDVQDIIIQYEEVLKNDIIEFSPKIEKIDPEVKLYGHREMDANFNSIEASSELSIGNEIVYVTINNEKFSLLA
ncbi:MAG: peptidase M14, partial [Flavobacteriaceae bacterium]|nr:peptidase M14 [Flavobacteriaceae bacterium]